MKITLLAFGFLPLVCACTATRHQEPWINSEAYKAFDTLKSLEGKWRGTVTFGDQQTQAEVSYEVVSAGSTVMERLFLGTPEEMITMYHKDGDRLLLTHYCAAGNQPRMQLVGWSAGPETILSFSFKDATNWGSEDDLIMHDARIIKINDDHITANWTAWSKGKPDHTASFDFQRVKTTQTTVLFSSF